MNNTQGCKRDLGARDRDLWLSTRDETLQKFSETETFDLGLETRPIPRPSEAETETFVRDPFA
jgi:hypothetical protein